MKNKKKNQSGFSSVEILITIGIFAIFSTGIFYLSLDTIQRDSKVNLDNKSLLYAQEGIEAVRNIRDKNFLLLTNGDHGLDFSGSAWSFGPAPESIESFYERTITIDDVYRDASGNISTEGTYYDPDTKKVTSEVTWTQKIIFTRSILLKAYISNWRGDDWIQTTCTEFDQGTFENTATTNLDAPPTDNCAIELEGIEMASEFFSSSDIGSHANDVEVDGNYAYLATNIEKYGLYIINISDPNNPSITSYLDVNEKGRYIKKDGPYVFMGVKKSSKGLAIVNVSNPSNPSITSTTNIGRYGNQPAVSGNYLYMAVNKNDDGFLVYDVSSKTSPTLIDSLDFGYKVHVIEIVGNYAYVGLEDDFHGFRVVDISDPSNVSEIASLDVDEEVNAIIITGTIAYVGTEDSNNALKVVNISNPENPSLVTSINVSGEIQDLAIKEDYLYAAVDESNSGLAAINISNPFSPYLAYNLDILGKGTGIDTDENYLYVSTHTKNKGLVIIGTTETAVETTGTYTSASFDTGSNDTQYNFIEWDHIEVPGSIVKVQMRTADSPTNLESAAWIGSDGTSSTYYENPRTIITLDPGASGVRYYQFKIYIESDGVSTPTIESVRINYTP